MIFESEELAQGVAHFFLPVLSLRAVDESFSFHPRRLGSRAPRLQPGGVCCGQLYAWKEDPEAGLSLGPQTQPLSQGPPPAHALGWQVC